MNKYNTLDILQQEVDIPDVVQNRANQAFDKICKDGIERGGEDHIAAGNRQETRRISRLPKKRIILVAAIITLVMATVTVAAAYLRWGKSISEGMRATEEQRVQMEESNMVTFVNQSCTDQGITITAVQSITDNYFTHLVFKVEGYEVEEGAQPGFETIEISVDGENDFSWGGGFYDGLVEGLDGRAVHADGTPVEMDENGMVIDYVMEDGSLEYHLIMAKSGDKGFFLNKPIHVEIKNLGTLWKAEYYEDITGTWTFDWDLQGSATMRECEPNVPLSNDEKRGTVVKAEISPISLRAEVDDASYLYPPELSGVKLKDGTLYPFLYQGPGRMDFEEDSNLHISAFAIDRIIDIDQVESLLFVKSYNDDDSPMTEENFYVVPLE